MKVNVKQVKKPKRESDILCYVGITENVMLNILT